MISDYDKCISVLCNAKINDKPIQYNNKFHKICLNKLKPIET